MKVKVYKKTKRRYTSKKKKSLVLVRILPLRLKMTDGQCESVKMETIIRKIDKLGVKEVRKVLEKMGIPSLGTKEEIADRMKNAIRYAIEFSVTSTTWLCKGCSNATTDDDESVSATKALIEAKNEVIQEKEKRLVNLQDINDLLKEKIIVLEVTNKQQKRLTSTLYNSSANASIVSAAPDDGSTRNSITYPICDTPYARYPLKGIEVTIKDSNAQETQNENETTELITLTNDSVKLLQEVKRKAQRKVNNAQEVNRKKPESNTVPYDSFKTVTHKRRSTKATIGTNSDLSCSLEVEKKMFHFHVWRLKVNTTAAEVLKFLHDKCPGKIFMCEALVARGKYSSFKISTTQENQNVIESPDFWPTGAAINRFFLPRQVVKIYS